MIKKKLDWNDPIKYANSLVNSNEDWVLLNSTMATDYSGQKSLLALKPKNTISGTDFEILKQITKQNNSTYFGYIAYEARHDIETYPKDYNTLIEIEPILFRNFSILIEFNHQSHQVDAYLDKDTDLSFIPQAIDIEETNLNLGILESNMSKQQYLSKVELIKAAIANGDIYQANLTRKFFTKLESNITCAAAFSIFKKLSLISPSPYSAFMKFSDLYIISSSPERFLKVDSNKQINTIPIKGSAKRSANKKQDEQLKSQLQNSTKDKAENLMIVDLSRNDLGRSSKAGSVKVDYLYKVSSYATIHHMSSSISSTAREDIDNIEVIKSCFPPGSMTGTPKIKAIEICSELEQYSRGIYSGCLGYINGSESLDLSVVIRTIIIQNNILEFQVGGAIIYDSEAINEYEETITKAAAICQALGIEQSHLAKI